MMPDRRMGWALILLAIVARAAAVLVLQSHTVPRSTYEHGEIAANLLAGRGFSIHLLGGDGPTSQQAPVYPVILAGAYALGGVETPAALLILQLGQALLAGVLVAGVLAMAREVAPGRRWVAFGAGLIAALHPTLIYAATHVQVALLAATLLAWTLAMAYRTGRTGRDRDALATGALLALLALTDPILALVAPGAIWAMFRGASLGEAVARCVPPSSRTGGIRPAVLMTLAAAIGVAPWIARNYGIHGEVVFIKSTFGYAFWQGNCALSEGTDKVARADVETALEPRGDGLRAMNEAIWKARHVAGYIDDIALTKSDIAMLGALPEPERSRILYRRAMADLRADPMRYPRLCLRRLRYFLLFDETNPKTRNLAYRAGHLGLSLTALFGLILMRPALRRKLEPTFLTAGLITLFHVLTITSARFHIPLEPLMGLWAAGGLSRWGRRDKAHTPAPVAIAQQQQGRDEHHGGRQDEHHREVHGRESGERQRATSGQHGDLPERGKFPIQT